MKEFIDLLEKKVKDNKLQIIDVDTDGRFASIGIDAFIETEQIGRIFGILELQARQNNYDCTFSIKPNNHALEKSNNYALDKSNNHVLE